MTTQPFTSTAFIDNANAVSTRVSASLNPAVPTGKLLIVEHISGWVGVGDGDVVDQIHADVENQQVYLPEHFASRPLNFGGQLGVARMHQFGSPCRLYVSESQQVQVIADANRAGALNATAIGYLIDT